MFLFQGTADLLKAILRVQESGLGDDDLLESSGEIPEDVPEDLEEISSESTAELEAVLPNQNASSSQPRVPCLSQMVQWWAKKWLPSTVPSLAVTTSNSPRSLLRRKAHSTSA